MATSLVLDASSHAPLHEQLYRALREAMVAGRLSPGTRLPATRALAEQLDLSRNTVMSAYSQLLAEGYLVGRHGSGTYVADELPERALSVRHAPEPSRPPRTSPPPLSKRGTAVATTPAPFPLEARVPATSMAFRVGPAPDAFPSELWGRLLHQRWQRSWRDVLSHQDPRGYLPLRQALANYLATARGVRCGPEQVLIVNGSQQAISLIAQLLLDPGEAAWVEDPGYPSARGALTAAGATLVPVPVDAEGMDVEAASRLRPDARLAVVTPSSQLPLGVGMSLRRRRALLEWAERRNAWIFEDDYDSEFRYVGRPLPALQGLTPDARVIYCGTFSKVLSPSLRLGYLVVPEALIEAFLKARVFADVHSPSLQQAVLTDFITQGHFSRHVRRMRTLYAERQALLVEEARRELPGLLEIGPAETGLHLLGWLPPGVDDRTASERAAAAGVLTHPLSGMRSQPSARGALVLGYAAVPEREISEGVRRLRQALR
ncbi:PLP-dependent aminotransferase family protein [Vitiosangium sp. GDMCC 1.1324]|uniref:MocR-like pyridoxine biosynthesis transcription factor PdxR n=1 Tax=Vitiosangium sp. (strain GDMCC 1.1324) TaxID=2138576 RepID=UPI001E33A1E1|nr:PLP-dependent aminotransferase family protein [Vitiosangium sp. GDMCC 1.1324]